jgi:hypothetical protein
VSAYSVVVAVHIMAVIGAYGLPLAYPVLIPYVRRHHPRAMPGLHDVQHLLNQRLTGPGTVIALAAGIYLASDGHRWGEAFVTVGLVAIATIAVVGGALIVPASRRMAELARADVEAGVTWSAEYDRVYRRYMVAEVGLGAVVLIAIFFMAAKPGG